MIRLYTVLLEPLGAESDPTSKAHNSSSFSKCDTTYDGGWAWWWIGKRSTIKLFLNLLIRILFIYKVELVCFQPMVSLSDLRHVIHDGNPSPNLMAHTD
jgi:hypothetical protein